LETGVTESTRDIVEVLALHESAEFVVVHPKRAA
jgi:hypothetical protein